MARAAQSSARSKGKSSRSANTSGKNASVKLNTGFFSVVLIVLALIVTIMLIWPSDEYSPLHTLKSFFSGLVGSLSWTVPVVLALGAYFAYRSDGEKSLLVKFLFCILSLHLLFLTMVEAFYVDSIAAGMGISSSYVNFLSFSYRAHAGGGLFGAILAWPLHSFMGRWGALILCIFATAIILFGTGVLSLERVVQQVSGITRKNSDEPDERQRENRSPQKPADSEKRPAPQRASAPERRADSVKRRPTQENREAVSPARRRPSGETRTEGMPAKRRPAPEGREATAAERRRPAPRVGKNASYEDIFEVHSKRPAKKTSRVYDEPLLDDLDMNPDAPVRIPNLRSGERPRRTVVRNDEDGFEIPRVFDDKTDPYSEFIDRPVKKKKKQPAPPAEPVPASVRKKPKPKIEKIDLMEAVRSESPEERNRKYVSSALSDHSKKPRPVLGYSADEEKTAPLSTRSRKDNTVLSEDSAELNYFFTDEPAKPRHVSKPEAPAPAKPEKAPEIIEKAPPAPKPSFFDAPVPEKKEPYVPKTKLAGMREDVSDKEYDYPPIDLMETGGVSTTRDGYEAVDMQRAEKLVETLRSFSVPVKITGISHGPAVTRFELLPAPGIKVSKIASYADDIAMNLAAESVRIEAPIPGKSAVGVELPNLKKEMVHLRDVLESNEAQKATGRLAVALGKDNSGKYIVADLASMPHVLIAGQTGSGKSVCINAIIISILYRSTPEEVRMIMIDPKMVELNAYNTIPHLLVPVVTDPKKAASALDWAVSEMTRRYKEFSNHGAKNIQSYNKRLPAGEKPMPQIVIIVDELADLMMTAPHDVEDAINRLAQLARAAGMHLVIATQRPSVNVITGVIKANIPTRIAFTVASGVDSRTILDSYGAEALLGKGDMLYLPPDRNKPLRIQGAWVSEEEVQAVVDYVSTGSDTNFDEDILEHLENAVLSDAEKADKQKEESDDQVDELFAVAVKAVIDNGQASISMLQRKLRVGYARAGRLIDDMAQRGFVSQSEGSKSREVLITREQYLELFGDSAE